MKQIKKASGCRLKKNFIILMAIILFAACETKVVYLTKPTLNDTTVLKAEMKFSEWRDVYATIQNKSVALYYLKDTAEKRKAYDTIMMALSHIDRNISDSNRNQIFKK